MTTLSIQDLYFTTDSNFTVQDAASLTGPDFWTNEAEELRDTLEGVDQDTFFYTTCRALKCELAATHNFKVSKFEKVESDTWLFSIEIETEDSVEPILIAELLEGGDTKSLALIQTFEDFEGVAARFDPESDEFAALCEAHPVLAEEFC